MEVKQTIIFWSDNSSFPCVRLRLHRRAADEGGMDTYSENT